MPILDTLPKEIQTRLPNLPPRNGAAPKNGHSLPQKTAQTAVAVAEPVEVEEQKLPPVYSTLVFETDVTNTGDFAPEWLILEQDRVLVIESEGANDYRVRHEIPYSEIIKARAEIFFGNGTLEVRTKTEMVSAVRFSQVNVAEANLIARQITARAKGEAEPVEAEIKNKICPRCRRVLPEDSEVCPACVNKGKVMMRLFQFLKPHAFTSVMSVVVLLGMTALDLIPPYIGGRIVDVITVQSNGDHRLTPVLVLVGWMAATRLLFAVLQYAQRRLNAYLGSRILVDIRLAVYYKFQQLSLGYYDKRSVGSVMSRITNDSDNLWDFLTDGIPWFVSNLLTLVGIGTILFKMNWQLAFLLLAPGPFIFMLTKWFMPRAHRRWHHVWHRISKMYSSLGSTLNGMRVVKAFAQEEREKGRFAERNRQVFEASYAANALWATYWPLIGILMSGGSFIVWIAGGHKVLQQEMTLGTLMAFNGYLWQFYGPFQNFSRVLDWMTRSMTAAERVFEVLDTDPDIKEASKPVPMPEMRGDVTFEHVSFAYDKGKRVLEEFDIHINAGEMIGLVGHSGAGKSTLINLLGRFYDVSEGTIKVDGVDIRQIRQEDFRHQLGIVLQEPYLFPGTIRDNIAYAKSDATTEEIMQAAKAANCHEFILKFPDAYDTQVGDRGQRLSGGERQRISIARAILHNPRILILDEATASVDTETEKQIQEAIARLIQGRTTIAIAHRLSTLRNANRLIVMKEGRMVECGSHDELMELDGYYAKLVKIQNEVNKIKAI
jgi:ATP-binding cassette subfamily B protein